MTANDVAPEDQGDDAVCHVLVHTGQGDGLDCQPGFLADFADKSCLHGLTELQYSAWGSQYRVSRRRMSRARPSSSLMTPATLAETCGLRPEDVDFMRAVVHPQVQYPAEPLKTKTSRTSVPIPASLAAELSAQIVNYGRHETLLTGRDGHQLSPWAVERAMRTARKKVHDLPAGFRYHDLRAPTSRACSSPQAPTSRPSRRACAMPAPRQPSTPTATSSPTATSR